MTIKSALRKNQKKLLRLLIVANVGIFALRVDTFRQYYQRFGVVK